MSVEFEHYGKIPRLRNLLCTITEKIDGTNAQILVPDDPAEPVLAGSRNRWITPESDNHGFARFVAENAETLRRLGPGRHYGEWWGSGIQRRYGLMDKRLSLFNTYKWREGLPEGLPPCVAVVPVLYQGPWEDGLVESVMMSLYKRSVAAPGWAQPEGVVVSLGNLRWKMTFDGDGHKGEPE